MKSSFVFNAFILFWVFVGYACPVHSVAQSPYMGGEVNLTKAPNGAVVREEVLKTGARILYLEPTTEKLADGVWCIGGYSLANTTVIEAEDGLIVYDTGDTGQSALSHGVDEPQARLWHLFDHAIGAGRVARQCWRRAARVGFVGARAGFTRVRVARAAVDDRRNRFAFHSTSARRSPFHETRVPPVISVRMG